MRTNNDSGLIVILLCVIALNTCRSCQCLPDPQMDKTPGRTAAVKP